MSTSEPTSAPQDRSHLDRVMAPEVPIPVHETVGLRALDAAVGTCLQELRLPVWLREVSGAPAVGAVAVLVDTAIGWSIASTMPRHRTMVTTHLRFELVRPLVPDDGILTARGHQLFIDADVGLGRAEIFDQDGATIGWGTMRAALVTVRPGEAAGAPVDSSIGNRGPVVAETVAGCLDLQEARADAGRAAVMVRCQPALANSSGAVHGGIVGLMGERAVLLAAGSVVPGEALRPLDFDVLYLRRLPADGGLVEARADVVNVTRRFVLVRGEVLDRDGRAAALVRLSFARPR